MFEVFDNCFDSLTIALLLIIGFMFRLIKMISEEDELNKEEMIESIPRRSEECPQQYLNGWLPVYDSHDLKKGEVKSVFALGRDLVIYRGQSGKVYVFDAYCPHLGANLGVGGTVVGDDIKCHFHGWQFSNQGDCNAIPGLEDNKIPKTAIKKWRSDEVNHFIYVWHHLEGKDPDWFMPKNDKFENFYYHGKNIFKPFCHIQDIIENEADVTHFNTIHSNENTFPHLLQYLIKMNIVFNNWKPCDAPNSHSSQHDMIVNVKIAFLNLPGAKVAFKNIGPACFNIEISFESSINVEMALTFNIITAAPLQQLFVMKFYFTHSVLGYLLAKIITPFLTLLVVPDMMVWNRKRFVRNPPLTKSDELIKQFRRWYKQFYSLNSKED